MKSCLILSSQFQLRHRTILQSYYPWLPERPARLVSAHFQLLPCGTGEPYTDSHRRNNDTKPEARYPRPIDQGFGIINIVFPGDHRIFRDNRITAVRKERRPLAVQHDFVVIDFLWRGRAWFVVILNFGD